MSKFKELVESLDREGLDELRRSVAEEVGERRQQFAIQMEHIHHRFLQARAGGRGDRAECAHLKRVHGRMRPLAAAVLLQRCDNIGGMLVA